jgi:GT2 family glycosyltransferase
MTREPPLFSVIIPTYNRPQQLSACLESLARLAYPADRFEVIVVDDGSATPLEFVTTAFHDRLNITLLTQQNAGPAAARNTGAAQAKGQFLAFTDDDCTPTPDWLHKLAARCAAAPECMIGGRTLNALPTNLYSTASQVIVDIVYAHYNAIPNAARFFASNNLTLPADRFRAIGGFTPTFTVSEDRELCDRWRQHGYRMIYAPEVQVYHAHWLTFRTFCRQHLHYGRGAARFHRVRAQRQSGHLMQELSFHTHLPHVLRQVLSQMRGRRVLSIIGLLMVWQVANAGGYFWEKMLRK